MRVGKFCSMFGAPSTPIVRTRSALGPFWPVLATTEKDIWFYQSWALGFDWSLETSWPLGVEFSGTTWRTGPEARGSAFLIILTLASGGWPGWAILSV